MQRHSRRVLICPSFSSTFSRKWQPTRRSHAPCQGGRTGLLHCGAPAWRAVALGMHRCTREHHIAPVTRDKSRRHVGRELARQLLPASLPSHEARKQSYEICIRQTPCHPTLQVLSERRAELFARSEPWADTFLGASRPAWQRWSRRPRGC